MLRSSCVVLAWPLAVLLLCCGPSGEDDWPPGDENEHPCEVPPCNGEDDPNGAIEEPCEEAPSFVAGEPMDGQPGSWVWVDFPETRCMDGSETGLAFEMADNAEGTLVYLQGGGLCIDSTTCGQVINPNGFDGDDFQEILAAGYMNIGPFDRADGSNPFRDFNLVFVPYCSGDLFGGDTEDGYGGRIHRGLNNYRAFLSRLVPTFEGGGPVVLAGSSAGGYGASIHLHRTRLAFGCTPVYLVNDSAPIFSDTYTRPCFQQLLRDAFALDSALPESCEACFGADGGGLGELLPFLAERHPTSRLALLTTTHDTVIRYLMGYGYSAGCSTMTLMPADEFESGVLELREEVADRPGTSMFIIEGSGHVFFAYSLSSFSVSGVSLGAWLQAMLEEDAGWETLGP